MKSRARRTNQRKSGVKRLTPTLTLRDRPYGGTLRTPLKPRLTSLNPVIQVNVALPPSLLGEGIITVGNVASAITNQGYSVSSFTITRIDCYAATNGAIKDPVNALFRYVPTNQAWIIESIDNVTAGTLSYVPPAVSSGPFSSSQSGQQLFVSFGLQTIILRASVVTLKAPAEFEPFLTVTSLDI